MPLTKAYGAPQEFARAVACAQATFLGVIPDVALQYDVFADQREATGQH